MSAGKAHLRRAVIRHEEAMRVHSLCKILRKMDILQDVLSLTHKRSLDKYSELDREDDFDETAEAPEIQCMSLFQVLSIIWFYGWMTVSDCGVFCCQLKPIRNQTSLHPTSPQSKWLISSRDWWDMSIVRAVWHLGKYTAPQRLQTCSLFLNPLKTAAPSGSLVEDDSSLCCRGLSRCFVHGLAGVRYVWSAFKGEMVGWVSHWEETPPSWWLEWCLEAVLR